MSALGNEHIRLLEDLRAAMRKQEGTTAYACCMEAASKLVEEAAYALAPTVPSTRVVELLLLSARIEEIGRESSLIEKAADVVEDEDLQDAEVSDS